MSKRDALGLIGARLQLPTLPEIVIRLNALIVDPEVGLQEIGTVIARDPALTAKVLRIANSAYYGLREPVLSPEQAAAVIGANALRNIVLQASIMQRYERFANLPDFDLNELWTHSAAVARLAQEISRVSRCRAAPGPDEAYTCGLLHDVGKVVLLESCGDEFIEVVRRARALGQPLHVVEAEVMGFSHIEVGALLASRWQLPSVVGQAIEFHHGPRERLASSPGATVIAIADQIAYRAEGESFERVAALLSSLAQRQLEIPAADFEVILELGLSPALAEEAL